jgi:Predicted double-glycine peptidase
MHRPSHSSIVRPVCVNVPRILTSALLLAVALVSGDSSGQKWLDVPYVKQVAAGCGSASLAMVIQYWVRYSRGIDPAASDAERIHRVLARENAKSIAGTALKKYLEDNGFSAFIFNGELQDLRHHVEKGRPVITCLAPAGRRGPMHYVVVVGVTEEAVIVNDPARGKLIREEPARFLRSWQLTGQWSMLAVPRQQSSAQ